MRTNRPLVSALVLTLAAGGLLAASAVAQDAPLAGPEVEEAARDADAPRESPEALRRRLIERFDADGDGVLNDQEAAAAREAMRARRGREMLGDRPERPARRAGPEGGEPRRAGGRPDPEADREHRRQVRARLLERHDANGDGRIDADERQAVRRAAHRAVEELLEAHDADGDGRFTPEERDAFIAELPPVVHRLLAAARAEEAPDARPAPRPDERRGGRNPMRQRMIERFDADGDGELNDEEAAAAREAMQRLREQRQEAE